MYPFQRRRRPFSFEMSSEVSVPHLTYRPNSFILVNRGLTLSAIVVSAGPVFVSPPCFTSIMCGARCDASLRLRVKSTLKIFVFIVRSGARSFLSTFLHWPSEMLKFKKKQESWAIAKMTARCALRLGALKIFWSPWLRGVRARLLFPKFLMNFCSDWAYKCASIIWIS